MLLFWCYSSVCCLLLLVQIFLLFICSAFSGYSAMPALNYMVYYMVLFERESGCHIFSCALWSLMACS